MLCCSLCYTHCNSQLCAPRSSSPRVPPPAKAGKSLAELACPAASCLQRPIFLLMLAVCREYQILEPWPVMPAIPAHEGFEAVSCRPGRFVAPKDKLQMQICMRTILDSCLGLQGQD